MSTTQKLALAGWRLSLAGLLVFLAFALQASPAWTEPYQPDNDAQVLLTLPSPGDKSARKLRLLRRQLTAEPENLALALDLARRYAALGRSAGDPRYYGYAQAALGPWWGLAAPPGDVLLLRAHIRQSAHEFDAALRDLGRLLARRPNHAQAWLSRAFILQVQGRPRAALESCRRIPRTTSRLLREICLSRAESLIGRSASAQDRIAAALAADRDGEAALRVWALTVSAELARRAGEAARAEQIFKRALGLAPRDAYLLGAYADLLLDQGRAEDLRDLLAGQDRNDALLLRLALAEQKLGAPQAQEHAATLAARIEASRRRGSSRHQAIESRFALAIAKEPDRALRLALANWRSQTEVPDARLVLEAALASGAPTAATPVLDWLRDTGLRDATLAPLLGRLREEGQS